MGGTGEFSPAQIAVLAGLGTSSGGFESGSNIGIDTTNAPGAVTYSAAISNPNSGANALGLTKLGSGILMGSAVLLALRSTRVAWPLRMAWAVSSPIFRPRCGP